MRNKKIVFAGLIKNMSNEIVNLKKRLEYLGLFFKEYKC